MQTGRRGEAVPRVQVALAALMAVTSMTSVQWGAALSKPAMETYGTLSTTWMRLAWAAVVLAIVVRPDLRRYDRMQLLSALALGAAIALMTLAFYAAVNRVPLGLVVAIQFLGPLGVATLGFTRSWRLIWPVVALAGVLFLVRNREGWSIDLIGFSFAIAAGVGWGAYILLLKHVGTAFQGLDGLAISFISAALIATPFGLVESGLRVSGGLIVDTIGLAILTPLLPYALEMMALRRLPSASFGILMSAEPAIGALFGFLILSQPLSLPQLVGIALVIAASVGAVLSGEGSKA